MRFIENMKGEIWLHLVGLEVSISYTVPPCPMFLSTFPPTNCNEFPWYNRQKLLGILIERNRNNGANPNDKLKTVGNAKFCCGITFTTHSLSCMIQPVTTLFTKLIRCIQNLYHIVKLHNFLVLGMV